MICQLAFKNFKSYKDRTVFDLKAENLGEFEDTLITQKTGASFLPVSVIYGPNGGGKSNLLQAFACLISMVVNPIYQLGKNRLTSIFQENLCCEPFIFDPFSRNEPTEFNLRFRTKGNEYRYNLAVLHDVVFSEALYRRTVGGKKTATLFQRENNVIELGPSIKKENINIEVNPKMPYFSFLAINYNLNYIKQAQEWFESCIIRNYANLNAEKEIFLPEDQGFKRNFIGALNEMGIDIIDYHFEEKNQLFVLHEIDGKPYPISFINESEGTKKMFASLSLLLIALAEGRSIIIDELNSKLHPKLLRYIITLFTSKETNNNGAQLIFTSYDTATMKNEIFRRDEIWFAALGDDHRSELYRLYEIRKGDGKRINHTAAYDKQYLEGRYGADPLLGENRAFDALKSK